jgi:hypothetical protein
MRPGLGANSWIDRNRGRAGQCVIDTSGMSDAGREPQVHTSPAHGAAGGVPSVRPPETLVLVLGVLLLQFGFIFSYVAAFHNPKPHRVPVGVVAPPALAQRLVGELNAIPGNIASARALATEALARQQIRTGSISAAILVNAAGTTDRLLYASGGGESVATTIQQVASQAEAHYHRHITSTDLVPLQSGDGRGLTGFYLVIGWVIGGYLMAAMLGMVRGAKPSGVREAATRLLALVPYAIVSGLGGALIVDQLLGALTGHLLALWWLGVLIVAAAAAATMAFQALFGIAGIGVVILAFVILGNPSAGGAYQPTMLPGFWRAISGWRIVYFGSHGITGHLLVLAMYVLAGTTIALVAAHRRSPATASPS